MKNLFKEAHKMTREMVEKHGVDYQAQFGLVVSYLHEIKKEEKTVKRSGYGSFSRKQIGVIFAASKRGDVKVESKFISDLYSFFTDLPGHMAAENYNKNSVVCDCVEDAITAIFANDYNEAQARIDLAQKF